MKPLLINATNRAVVNTDNHQFYFNIHLTLRKNKIQNDVLTKKVVANWTKHAGCISGGFSALFMIYKCIKPNTRVRTAAHVEAHASHMINGTGTLMNFAYGTPAMFHNGGDETSTVYNQESSPPSNHEYEQDRASSLYSNTRSETRQLLIQEEYIDEEIEALNKNGRDDLNDL